MPFLALMRAGLDPRSAREGAVQAVVIPNGSFDPLDQIASVS